MTEPNHDRYITDTAPRQSEIKPFLWKLVKPLASLQLTVLLFSLSILLIFFATMAQMEQGIWTVVEKYIKAWIVWVPLQQFVDFFRVFFEFGQKTKIDASMPFPGGIVLGSMIFINLIAAHAVRFKMTWKRSGLFMIHAGLILLLIGEVIARFYSVEQIMRINEGQSVNFSEITRQFELAFTVPAADNQEEIISIPGSKLIPGKRIKDELLPVDVEVLSYFKNSTIVEEPDSRVTKGLGTVMSVKEEKEVAGVDISEKDDIPSLYVTFYKKGTDEKVGTYLFSIYEMFFKTRVPQTVEVSDKSYDVSFRFHRIYKPFSIYLIDFQFERYTGSEKAKGFASEIRLIDEEASVEREVRVWMNHPLRYRGETFYQAGFDKASEAQTTLQVVRNPGWIIPYVSCIIMTLGLLVHFGISLQKHLAKRGIL
jgi:hypothetical protein